MFLTAALLVRDSRSNPVPSQSSRKTGTAKAESGEKNYNKTKLLLRGEPRAAILTAQIGESRAKIAELRLSNEPSRRA